MTSFEKLDIYVQDYLTDLIYRKDELLKPYTSMRIGGIAKRFALPETKEMLILLLNYAISIGLKPILLGNGSNTIFGDSIDQLVVCTKKISGIQLNDDNKISILAGTNLATSAVFACENSLSGFEFAHGIPGSIGGAVYMNAGAYGGEMKDVIDSVKVYDYENGIVTLENKDLDLGYRHSIFCDNPNLVVLEVVIKLEKSDSQLIREKMNELMEKRSSKQPLEFPSSGSFFKRPEGFFAGKLIEDAGLKGFNVGDMAVSDKHAGFIINKGNGTFDDLMRLVQIVTDRVKADNNISLEPEVRLIKE